MDKKKVVVLGAGISGLTFSIELLLKGYQVTLIEKNNEIGGLCSGYFVNGHYIDGCLHWLMGTKKDSKLYKIWQTNGGFAPDQEFISLPTLGSFEYQGTTVTFYRDLEKTRVELTKLSPEDKKNIDLFINSSKEMTYLMSRVQGYRQMLGNEYRRYVRNYSHIIKCMKLSREDYAKRFKHPAIQFAIKNCQTGYSNMFFYLDLYGIFSSGNADIPVGGALYLVERIKNKFLSLGGELLVNTEAKEVVVNNNKADSVITNKGEIKGDYIVSCLDAKYTLEKLLDNKYQVKQLTKVDKNIDKQPISSCYNVYIAVNGDTSNIDVPTGLNISSIKVGKSETDFLLVRPYHFDKCFIKDGKTVVSLFVDQNQDDYQYFASLSKEEYKKEVKRINNALIDAFKKRYPEFKDKVELLSYFSPIELKNRTNSSYGAIQAYSFTDKGPFYIYNGKIKSLDNFYLCSQWNRAIGGTPTAILSATSIAKKFK